jgi:hypothetical protein
VLSSPALWFFLQHHCGQLWLDAEALVPQYQNNQMPWLKQCSIWWQQLVAAAATCILCMHKPATRQWQHGQHLCQAEAWQRHCTRCSGKKHLPNKTLHPHLLDKAFKLHTDNTSLCQNGFRIGSWSHWVQKAWGQWGQWPQALWTGATGPGPWPWAGWAAHTAQSLLVAHHNRQLEARSSV